MKFHFFGRGSRSLFVPLFESITGHLGLLNSFEKGIAKVIFSQKAFIMILGSIFSVLGCLGNSFLVFCGLGDGLET